MAPELRLYEDILNGGASTKAALPAMARMIYVVHGAVSVGERRLGDAEAWHGEGEAALKAGEHGATLYVSATVSNQGGFYPRFDAVVLLSAPADVLLRRIAARTTNDYGKRYTAK